MKVLSRFQDFCTRLKIVPGLFFATGVISLMASNSSFAQEKNLVTHSSLLPNHQTEALEQSVGQLRIEIRTIRATHPYPNNGSSSQNLVLDERLADLRSQLQNLEFKTFKWIAQDAIVTPLKRKGQVSLSENTTLTVRPLYMENNQIGIWLKWSDLRNGNVLLDTRMHLMAGESVITGTDSTDDTGLILAIRADRH